MKKIVSLGLCLVAALALLAGCGGGSNSNSTQLADGVYTAQADETWTQEQGYGWKDTLAITVKDGKVTQATFEAYDADGNAKSVPGNYEGMDPEPSVWIPELSQKVQDAGFGGTVDGVAGATMSSGNAQKLFDAIQKEGKPGETIEVTL